MIEQSLVNIYSTKPARRFVGCGALVEGGYVATCRHVWRMATERRETEEQAVEAEVEFPHRKEKGAPVRSPITLVDNCTGSDASPDLVFLLPSTIPSGLMTLQVAAHERLEIGYAYSIAGLRGLSPGDPTAVRDVRIAGTISEHLGSDGLRQFTGSEPQGFWAERGCSGSPLFVAHGQQLAGILSLSMLGADEGRSQVKEAFIVPGTLIRSHLTRLIVAAVSRDQHMNIEALQPVLDAFGANDVPVSEIPARLLQFAEAAKAQAAQPVQNSNNGADIDAVIGASREKVNSLDTSGAREILQAKINEEEEARHRRVLPLLKERAAVEQLAFDYDAAKATRAEVSILSQDDFSNWVELGNLYVRTGALRDAASAYRSAEAAARRAEDDRNLSVSHNKIGDVLVAQGDREDALAAYRASLAIAETLARRDPANTEWQRDLSISHEKIGNVLVAQGDREDALAAYRASLAIAETLARRDPANTEWQRDLSVSHEKIGNVLVAQGDREDALAAYRASLAIRETLARRDPANTEWQRDLSVSHDRIGDVLVAQGDREDALAAYRASLAIRETLARRDPANTEWQRDLSVSHNRIGDVLVAQGDREDALAAYRASLAIAETLARRDPANTQWQRDLIISCVKLSQAEPSKTVAHLNRATELAVGLEKSGRLAPVDAWIPQDLRKRLANLKRSTPTKREGRPKSR